MIISYKNKITNGIKNIFNNLNSPSFDINLSNKGIDLVLKELRKSSELNLIPKIQDILKDKYKNNLVIEDENKIIFEINNKLYKFNISKKEVSVSDNINDRFVNLGTYKNLREELKNKLNYELKIVLPIIFSESIKLSLIKDKKIENSLSNDNSIELESKIIKSQGMSKK